MAENPGEELRRWAADQAKLDAMSPEERAAEQQRRAELFRQQQEPQASAPAKPKVTRKQWIKRGVILAVVLGAWAIFANLVDSTSTSASRLDAGDCFEFPAAEDGSGGDSLETPDCADPHDAQFFYRFGADNEATPEATTTKCLDEGGSNIQNDLLDGPVEIGFFEIGRENSDSALRVLCYIKHSQNVTGSHVEFGRAGG